MVNKKRMEELFREYYAALVRYSVSNGISKDNAPDVVSEAFLRAIRKKEQFLQLNPQQQKAWLYTTVGYIIREQKDKPSDVPFSAVEGIEEYINENDDLSRFQANEDFQDYLQMVEKAFANDDERHLFSRIVDHKVDYSTLSRQENLPPASIRVLIHRLRKKASEFVNNLLN